MSPGRTVRSEGRYTYVLKVTLDDIKPPIWRSVQVPGTYTLGDLHEVLQILMGWENYHLHSFFVGGIEYQDVETVEDNADAKDEDLVTLETLLPGREFKFRYVYDFGDDWVHTITVDSVIPTDQLRDNEQNRVICLKGKRAAPPEDCGSVPGYYQLIDALDDPTDPENRELLEWADGFDPDRFDIDSVNDLLVDV